MKVILVEPGKAARVTEIGEKLKDMQKVVGGLIQAIYPYEELVAIVCGDESKLNGEQPNRALYDDTGNLYDVICGTFFITGLSEDNFASIPDELVDKFLGMFRRPEVFMQVNDRIMVIKV